MRRDRGPDKSGESGTGGMGEPWVVSQAPGEVSRRKTDTPLRPRLPVRLGPTLG